jgi:hypothetical protein
LIAHFGPLLRPAKANYNFKQLSLDYLSGWTNGDVVFPTTTKWLKANQGQQ